MADSPKVTLLGLKGNTYLFRYGKSVFEFNAGVPKRVPAAVALILSRKADRSSRPLFKVEEMPTVVGGTAVRVPRERTKKGQIVRAKADLEEEEEEKEEEEKEEEEEEKPGPTRRSKTPTRKTTFMQSSFLNED